jgi:hypothetical protein
MPHSMCRPPLLAGPIALLLLLEAALLSCLLSTATQPLAFALLAGHPHFSALAILCILCVAPLDYNTVHTTPVSRSSEARSSPWRT